MTVPFSGLADSRFSRERWAYCKLHGVVERLNKPDGRLPYAELESEVRLALAMAPRIDGYEIVGRIGEPDTRRSRTTMRARRRVDCVDP